MRTIINNKISYVAEKLKANNYLLVKYFILIFIFYILFYSSIIRANEDYENDLSNQIHYDFSINNSVYNDMFLISEFRTIFHTSKYVLDLSPFSQIVAVFFLTLSGLLLIKVFSDFKGMFIFKVIAALIIGLNPAFLECISSKFNAMYFAMAIFFSLLPIMFYKNGSIKYIIITILSLLLSFSLCHFASGIYFVIVILYSLRLYINGLQIKKILKSLCKSLIIYFFTLLIFCVMLYNANKNGLEYRAYIFDDISRVFNILLVIYKEIYITDFIPFWSSIILILIIIVIITSIVNSKQNKIISLFVVTFSFLLVIIFQFGIVPIIVPDYYNTGKYCMGYGITLSILILMSIENIKKFKILLVFPLILTWCFGVYSIHYGNLLNIQKNYNNVRLLTLVDDLDNMPVMKNNKDIKISFIFTDELYSPIVMNAIEKYKGLKKLIPLMLKDPNYFKYYYYKNDIEICETNYYPEEEFDLYLDTYFHEIKTNNRDFIIVRLK